MQCGSIAQLKSDAVKPQWSFVVTALFFSVIVAVSCSSGSAQDSDLASSERPLLASQFEMQYLSRSSAGFETNKSR